MKNQEPVLVVMAAGMGSRFGGLKQMTPVDGEGCFIIDYSLYDAYRAGFRRVAFIIKKELEEAFRQTVGHRMERFFEVHYIYQELTRLPEGYATMLTGDGANLSQGQRQLLAIARAAVADPPVLILDEATSSVDTRTEALIEKGMDQLMEGRTVFVIAHRLSTVRNANAIMVLEQGNIVERGDHDALLAQKGKYYQLYHGMFELS